MLKLTFCKHKSWI